MSIRNFMQNIKSYLRTGETRAILEEEDRPWEFQEPNYVCDHKQNLQQIVRLIASGL